MKSVLHITQSDIRIDARIRKTMAALAEAAADYELRGIGVAGELGGTPLGTTAAVTRSIDLASRKLSSLFGPLRHAMEVLELTGRAIPWALKEKPAVVHCHDTPALPAGVLLKWLTGAKLIYDAHELESDRNGISKVEGTLTRLAERALWPVVDFSITVSPSIDKWYQDTLGPKDSEVILNSPALDDRAASVGSVDKDYLRNKFSIPADRKIFMYVGLLCAGRGIERAVEAFSDGCDSHVVFMGRKGELSDKLEAAAEAHPNIHVHGPVPHQEVVGICQSADVGLCLIENVSLSDYYCLPNKLFEYCFAGIPVIASDFPDISELVQEYRLGVCCDLDAQSIRGAIRRFEDGDAVDSVDVDGLDGFSWEAQKAKLLNIYERLT